MQLLALVHDTPLKYAFVDPDGAVVGTDLQLFPFQRTAIGLLGVVTLDFRLPTAMQLVALAHDTALSTLDSALAGTGLVTIFHFLPAHRSMSARDLPFAETKLPTATQLARLPWLLHETPSRKLRLLPPGFAIATTDQFDAAPAVTVLNTRQTATIVATRPARRARLARPPI